MHVPRSRFSLGDRDRERERERESSNSKTYFTREFKALPVEQKGRERERERAVNRRERAKEGLERWKKEESTKEGERRREGARRGRCIYLGSFTEISVIKKKKRERERERKKKEEL